MSKIPCGSRPAQQLLGGCMAFNTETLQALGLNDEQVKGVMAEHGKDVNALKEKVDQIDGVIAERDSLQAQVNDITAQLTDAQKQAKKGSESASLVSDLQEQLKTAQIEAADKLASQQKSFAIDKALTAAGAKNAKATLALLDTDKVSVDDNGQLLGLSEQLDVVKAENSFLFDGGTQDDSVKKPGVQAFSSGNPSSGSPANVDLSKMSYRERVSLKHANPERYEAALKEQQGGND